MVDRLDAGGTMVSVVRSGVAGRGTVTMNSLVSHCTEMRFEDGTRLRPVSFCGILAPHVDSDGTREFFFHDNGTTTHLLAVRDADGRLVDGEVGPLEAHAAAERTLIRGALLSVPLLLVSGIFAYAGFLALREAARARRRLGIAKGRMKARELVLATDGNLPAWADARPQTYAERTRSDFLKVGGAFAAVGAVVTVIVLAQPDRGTPPYRTSTGSPYAATTFP